MPFLLAFCVPGCRHQIIDMITCETPRMSRLLMLMKFYGIATAATLCRA